jgi:hypothetical protein
MRHAVEILALEMNGYKEPHCQAYSLTEPLGARMPRCTVLHGYDIFVVL